MADLAPPTLTVTNGVAHLAFATDDYSLDFAQLGMSKHGALFSEVTARHGPQILHMARFDLLNQREQEHFHQRCRAVNGSVADWQSRLQSAIPGLKQLLTTEGTSSGSCWDQAVTVADFLAQPDEDLAADVRDLLVPGCITLVAAPRASCKTIVAHALGLALAQGGLFRGDRVPKRRVLLVDRDNAPALIRKRMRWLGGHGVSTLKILTRDQAPPLTDTAAWAQFPVDDYEVVIVDSIGAATEGVSEKEGKQTQQYLATLKDLAQRGPALLCLDNTNKAAQNYRGRGEKGDAVDILYEARNITGWTPTHGDDWWEALPDFGEHTWQQRASRRKGQQVLRIAFVPSKFRLGMDPEPFCLEIDTRQEPWTLIDCTEDLATAGARAAQEHTRQERQKLEYAALALVHYVQAAQPTVPLKREAENHLRSQGLTARQAKTLLEDSYNRDRYPDTGLWHLRGIPGSHGSALGVYLSDPALPAPTGEEDHVQKNLVHNPPHENTAGAPPLSDIRMPGCVQKTDTQSTRNDGVFTASSFVHKDASLCTKPTLSTPAEILGKKGEGSFVHTSPTPEESCPHEHVNDAGTCNDCGNPAAS
jgi:hypothetical protein